MTLEQIQYFVISVEKESFSAAGEELFVSHSSVSRGVSVLEKELGVKLLVRGRKKLLCTEAGEMFYRRSKMLLQQVQALKDSVTEFRQRQTLQLCSIGIFAPRFFELCRSFQQQHPEVEMSIKPEDQRAAAEKLRSGSVDMALTFSYSMPLDGTFDSLVLEQGSFCALVSPRHELADRTYLTDDELAARSDILGENPFHNDRERRRDEPWDLQSNLLRIKTGNGITVLPEHAAAEYGHGCVQIPIRGKVEYQLMLVWDQENRSRALAEAVAFFQKSLDGPPETT